MNSITNKFEKLITSQSQLCCVIGDPIEHSLSPLIHNCGYRAIGIEDDFVYTAFQVKPENLAEFCRVAKAIKIRGISVTLPHKQSIMQWLDQVDPIAKKIGAVNSIVLNEGSLRGFNTDWLGIVIPIEKRVPLQGKKVAIIGAGGAARAAVFGCVQKKAQVTIMNRTFERAQALAVEFGVVAQALNELKSLTEFDVVINATSVGMYPDSDQSAVAASCFKSGQLVFDSVYGPVETKFLTDAKSAGAVVIDGIEMLLAQAIEQFDLYTERRAPAEVIEREVLKLIDRN